MADQYSFMADKLNRLINNIEKIGINNIEALTETPPVNKARQYIMGTKRSRMSYGKNRSNIAQMLDPSYSGHVDIKYNLKTAAKMLNCSTRDVAIYSLDFIESKHGAIMSPVDGIKKIISLEDIKPLGSHGFFVRSEANHVDSHYVGTGLSLYKIKSNPMLSYVKLNSLDAAGDFYGCFYFRKGQVFKILRVFYKYYLNSISEKCPILPEQTITTIKKNSIDFLTNIKILQKYNVKARRGILLHGDPGNGKTMACKWIRSLGVKKNIHSTIITTEHLELALNSGRSLSNQFCKNGITFFDDIDASILKRDGSGERICNALLRSLDGMDNTFNGVFIFSTNEKVNHIDPAFSRPGRIDQILEFKNPTDELRRKLIEHEWPQDVIKHTDIDMLVKKSDGWSFAELELTRSIMVSNYVLNGKWDFEKSLEECKKNRPNDSSFGFVSNK